MNCPICDNELKTDHCAVCGFDSTSSVELYPTFFFTVEKQSIARSRREWKLLHIAGESETPNIIRCKVCGERLFFGEKACPKCGLELKWRSNTPSEDEVREEAARIKAYKAYYNGESIGIITDHYVNRPDGTIQKAEENTHLPICEISQMIEPGTVYWSEETLDLLKLSEAQSPLKINGYIKDKQGEKRVTASLEKPKLHIGVKVESAGSFRYVLGTKETYTESDEFFFERNTEPPEELGELAKKILDALIPNRKAINPFLSAKVGDLVEFGHYEQDGDLSNGAESIQWRVLSKEDGKTLVISEYELDAKPYNELCTDITWEECTLRKWLNGAFYDEAFTDDEKQYIKLSRIINEDNNEYLTKGGADTDDYVFLLSMSEAEKYFADDDARIARPTQYAKNNGATASDSNDAGWGWLRSPGERGTEVAGVYIFGNVMTDGIPVNYANGGVRPALWIDLKS